MVGISKLVKYNLEDEARQLRDMGYSYEDISKILKQNHPQIEDIKALAAMSVMRFFDSDKENIVVNDIAQGKDPVDDMISEFRSNVRDVHKRCTKLSDRAEKLLDKLEASDDTLITLKAMKEVRDGYAQLVHNYESLIKYGEGRMKTFQNINLKKEIHVKNMLVGVTKHLCPECKRKISTELEKFIEEDN